jgi:hypothetical protein
MKTDKPEASRTEHPMLRRAIAGLAFVVALAVAGIAPAAAQSGPICDRFGEGTAGLSGWGACPNAPNIAVDTSNVNSIGGSSDYYLHLRDLSGASAACSSDRKYVGDWNAKMGGCGQFCFDFKVFVSGSPPGPITPSFTIWSGSLAATFVANFTVTSNDPWRQNICAPINLIDPGQNLPSSGSGKWVINPTGNAYSANWNTIIQNVTAVQLPIDWTSDPDEEAGYDNLCMSPGGCDKPPPPPPVVTGCLQDAKAAVTCNGDGTYTLTLSGGGFTGSEITLTSATAGVTVTPPQQPWAATTTWILAGGTAGEAVTLEANATKIGGGSKPGTDECCSGEIKLTLPDCPKPIPVDVKIAKTEAKMPVGEPPGTHWFDLTVTNAGAAFTYPAGSITVTDNAPAGMTVTSATGTGWVCTPATVTGPGALTCTYTPGGTLAANASLPPILVKTKMTEPGTVQNCAIVGLGASSGLVDSDPTNNKSCIPVTTRQLCPPPMVPGPVPGQCVCPAGEVLIGGACVTQTNCQPPMVPGPVAGQCVCPAGEVLIGGACVRQTSCQPPMVPGAVPGQCVCPAGEVLVGGACVRQTNCQPPLVPNAAGQCVCPAGEVLRGRECVKQTTCQPPLVPNAAGKCACPAGEVLRGRECVKQTTCQPPLVPNAAGQCACPAGEVLRGRECVKETTGCQPPMVPGAVSGQCVCPAGEVAVGGACVSRDRAQPGLPLPGLPQPGFPQSEPGTREPASPQGQGKGAVGR